MTGGADGAVRLWEWGHGHPITTLRQAGSFPKVTKVLFNAQGNKVCILDFKYCHEENRFGNILLCNLCHTFLLTLRLDQTSRLLQTIKKIKQQYELFMG